MKHLVLAILLLILPATMSLAVADVNEPASAVIQTFNDAQAGSMVESFDKTREQHEVLFFMGVALLILIFMTAGFGLAMVLGGKQVFVQHMVCAGATIFLALAHAVAAVVWFFPYR
jgi:hypothetical protein